MKFDCIVIGGGRSGRAFARNKAEEGAKVCLVSAGGSLHASGFPKSGAYGRGSVFVLEGHRAIRKIMGKNHIDAIFTDLLGSEPLEAPAYVLATGRFASHGLQSENGRIVEPLFGLDLHEPPEQAPLTSPDFFARQAFMSYRVKTDADGHPSLRGEKIDNLRVIGSLLSE